MVPRAQQLDVSYGAHWPDIQGIQTRYPAHMDETANTAVQINQQPLD